MRTLRLGSLPGFTLLQIMLDLCYFTPKIKDRDIFYYLRFGIGQYVKIYKMGASRAVWAYWPTLYFGYKSQNNVRPVRAGSYSTTDILSLIEH